MSISYRIFAGNTAGGPIDYSTVVATVSGLTWTGTALPAPSQTRYGVRAYDTVAALDDGNTDAAVLILINGAGADVTNQPKAPQAATATPAAGGTVNLTWLYPYTDAATRPTGFHVYQGPFPGALGGSPVLTVPFGVGPLSGSGGPSRLFRGQVTGLTGGSSYQWGIAAYNAAGDGPQTIVTATAATASTAPSNPTNLTATLV